MSEYCWMFGDHRGNPCLCGYPNKQDKELIALRKQLEIAMEYIKADLGTGFNDDAIKIITEIEKVK